MAKENNDINKTIATVELAEAIMHKLGITRSIEELVESYNMTLPFGFPIYLMNVAPLLMSEDRSKYPECAKNVFFPWYDILACMFSKHKHLPLSERLCPECGERMLTFHYTSPVWTWNSLCGRAGVITICPSCPRQVEFSLTIMN
jgi:hypothetical protein